MYLGRKQLGDSITLSLLTLNGSGVAAMPQYVPVLKVWSNSAQIFSREMPVVDRYNVPGLFYYQLFLGSDFTTGLYHINYWWLIDADDYEGSAEDYFEVVAGGDDDGATLAMHYFKRPHADFVVRQTERGDIRAGRNPVLR